MRRKLVVVLLSLGLLLGTAGIGSADPGGAGPNPNANCNAIFGYVNTHHPELLGDLNRADVTHLFKELADQFGVTPGDIYAPFVHAHLGDFAACESLLD